MSESGFQNIKILTSEDIKRLIVMDDAIDAMEKAFASFSDGTSHVPQRYISDINNLNLFFKPAFCENLGRVSVKIITQQTAGKIRGVPTIQGMVLLLDMESGQLLSLMDGAYITAIRTGAAGGIAAKLLAPGHAKTIALFGCGTQGKTLMEAVSKVRQIKQAFLYDLNPEAAGKFKTEMEKKLGIPMHIMNDTEYLKEAEIICTATNSKQPLCRLKDISKGTHINAIGSYQPDMQEIDPAILVNGKVFVDSRKSVLKESGDLIKPINEGLLTDTVIEAEIGELINKETVGRQDQDDITIFKSVGLGVQDLFLANMIYEKYLKQ